jgi:hypothetical protein
MTLAAYADRSGMAWPTQKVLVEVTELSHDSVQKHVALLEQSGLISIERPKPRGGQRQGFKYQLKTSTLRAARSQAAQSVQKPARLERDHHHVQSGVAQSSYPQGYHAHSVSTTTLSAAHHHAVSFSKGSFAEQNQQLKPTETSLKTKSINDVTVAQAPETSTAKTPETSISNLILEEKAAQAPETSKEGADRPSRAELEAKYPDLLQPNLKRIPTSDIDQRWQATPEPDPGSPGPDATSLRDPTNLAPSSSLVRIELSKRLRRPVSDAELEAYLAQQTLPQQAKG